MERMNLETLRKKLDSDNIALFDVRGDDAYEIEHIPGAKKGAKKGARHAIPP